MRYARVLVISLLVLSSAGIAAAQEAAPLLRAHAHNDYEHARPLVDALSHGFCSVEADIHLVDGKLLVGHDPEDVTPERTLQALYLDPLLERVRGNGGRVYRAGPVFTLLIDLKTDGEATYAALGEVLTQYAEMLTESTDTSTTERAVTVIISGNTPRKTIMAESPRLATIDGRMPDLEANTNAHAVPLFSAPWQPTFQWTGKDNMPRAVRKKLKEIVEKAHAQGRRVRFYGAPDQPAIWEELLDAGVDLINTDKLDELSAFLAKHDRKRGK